MARAGTMRFSALACQGSQSIERRAILSRAAHWSARTRVADMRWMFQRVRCGLRAISGW